jgi:hypothetical protein
VEGGGVDGRLQVDGRFVRERTGGQIRPRVGVAGGVERDESAEVFLSPPADGVEVNGRQGSVEQDGFAGIHLAERVGRGELLALHGLGNAAAVVAAAQERGEVA